MSKLYFLPIFLFMVIACTDIDKGNISQTNKDIFYSMLDKGYSFINTDVNKKVIINSTFVAKNICVFSDSKNTSVNEEIKHFYDLFKNSINMELKFVQELKMCPDSTNLYINLHDGYKRSVVNTQWAYVLHKKNMRYREIKGQNKLAFAGIRVKKNKVISLVVINQLSKYKLDEGMLINLKSVIIQELFQATFLGRDIVISNISVSSILHESERVGVGFILSENINSKSFERHWSVNPKGLCSLDLWYFVLSSKFIKSKSFFSETDKYKQVFNEKFKDIVTESLKMTTNEVYKDLFDSRCSGANAGINTKIGIRTVNTTN